MATPLVIVNFKTYREATGENAVRLAKACEESAKKAREKAKVAVAVQATDIFRVAKAVKDISVFAQHIDNFGQGKFTGYMTAEAAKEAGAVGTLLNHAEHKLAYPILETALEKCRQNGITTVACAADRQEAARIAKLRPGYIAVEPPELIGTLNSVSKANPGIITSSIDAVRKIANTPVLCGAGIANGEDVKKAVDLGTEGILVATAVVLAEDPEKALLGLLSRL